MPNMMLGGVGSVCCVAPVVICFLIWRNERNYCNGQLLDCQKTLYVDNMPGRLPTRHAWESEELPGIRY